MKFGQFEIHSFVEQQFKLDGGMMFGVVPKTMWSKLVDSDENNLVSFVTHCYVLKANGKNIIFDVGLGDTLDDREKKIYSTDGKSSLDEGLRGIGLTTDDIDYVLPTHVHTDHTGAAVKLVDNDYVPRFPNAKYLICKEEWEAGINPNERTAATYRPERMHPLKEFGQLELIDANTEVLPGVLTVYTGGHTAGHVGIEMESEGQRVWFYGDIFPSVHHIRIPYIAAADLDPMQVLEVKKKLVPRLIKEDVVLAFDHDINVSFGRVVEVDGRPRVEPVALETTKAAG